MVKAATLATTASVQVFVGEGAVLNDHGGGGGTTCAGVDGGSGGGGGASPPADVVATKSITRDLGNVTNETDVSDRATLLLVETFDALTDFVEDRPQVKWCDKKIDERSVLRVYDFSWVNGMNVSQVRQKKKNVTNCVRDAVICVISDYVRACTDK